MGRAKTLETEKGGGQRTRKKETEPRVEEDSRRLKERLGKPVHPKNKALGKKKVG